jgi:hypothetical protein
VKIELKLEGPELESPIYASCDITGEPLTTDGIKELLDGYCQRLTLGIEEKLKESYASR